MTTKQLDDDSDSLAGYLGPEFHEPLRKLLKEADFVLRSNGRANKTIRVEWHKTYVAYWNETVKRGRAVLGYRFDSLTPYARNECPSKFSLQEFCNHYQCPESAVEVFQDGGKLFLHIRESEWAIHLLRRSVGVLDDRSDPGGELAHNPNSKTDESEITETTREALRQERIGQEEFRRALLNRFGGACVVTKLSIQELLRASHIKPWRDATNEERLDPDNGLLLSPNLDALFDIGFITFDLNGSIRVSKQIHEDQLQRLGPIGNLQFVPSLKQADYLAYHAIHVFRND